MATTDDVKNAAMDNAVAGIASSSADGVSVSVLKPADQLAALDKLSANEATKKPHRGVRFTKLISPGPTG